mgnify:CR=1 FL=1
MEQMDIKSLTKEELTKEIENLGEKKFRASQMYEWMHKKLVSSFDEMTNLSKDFREKCKEFLGFIFVVSLRRYPSLLKEGE